jgi:hypothetical protein
LDSRASATVENDGELILLQFVTATPQIGNGFRI